MLDLNDLSRYTQEYVCDLEGNVTNLDGYTINGETAEMVKMAYFVKHLSSQLYFEEVYGKENAPSYMSVSKEYNKKALQLLGFQNYGLDISQDNKALLEAILSGKGHVNLEIDNDHAALLKMFKREEMPFYSTYLNHMYKGSELAIGHFDLRFDIDKSTNKVKVSFDNYLVPYEMEEVEKNLKRNVMTARYYLDNYELQPDGRLVNLRKDNAYEDASLPNYKWAQKVYEDAQFIRSETLKKGIEEQSLEFYMESVLYNRMLQQSEEKDKKNQEPAQNARQAAGTPQQEQAPKPDKPKPKPKPVLKPINQEAREAAPAQSADSTTNSHQDYEEKTQVKQSDMPKAKTFMSFNEIANYVNNYYVKSGKVFHKNGNEITSQEIIDKVKTAIMFYCEARDLRNLLTTNYHQKEQNPMYYFNKIFEKYAANGEVNDFGTNKLINALLNCNGHLEENYLPVFADKYAILKGNKKDYVESYLRLKFKERGLSLESLNVKFENIGNNYIKATTDMKLVPLKDKNKTKDDNKPTVTAEQSTMTNGPAEGTPSKSDADLTIDELKAKINEAQAHLARLESLLQKLEPNKSQTNSGPAQAPAPQQQTEPQQALPPHQDPTTRKVKDRRKCSIVEKIKNAAIIAGAIIFGENVTNRTPEYRNINLQVGYLRYEGTKKNIVITTNHIKALREKLSASKGLTEKERKKLEKKINKLAKKAKDIQVTQEKQPQSPPPQPQSQPQSQPQPEPEMLALPPHQESVPTLVSDPSAASNTNASDLTSSQPNQTAENLIKNNPLTFTDEEWNNMDLDQQKACAKIKLHEATVTGAKEDIAYWKGICDGLEFQTQLSSNQIKGR